MKIAVFGTGSVGQTFSTKLASLGHTVVMGTRDTAKTLANKEKDRYGTPSVAEFLAENASISLATYKEAAKGAELIVNATRGDGSIAALTSAGELENVIIIDIANPLDFSTGGLPTLIPSLSNTTSLGEEIQKALPKAHVVKTLNTMWCGLMVNPAMVNGGDHINYISGNDAAAKATTIRLLKEFGWKEENLLDLGDISGARGVEATLPLWVRIWSVTQNGAFNFKKV